MILEHIQPAQQGTLTELPITRAGGPIEVRDFIIFCFEILNFGCMEIVDMVISFFFQIFRQNFDFLKNQ